MVSKTGLVCMVVCLIYWHTIQGPRTKVGQSKEQTSQRIILSERSILCTNCILSLWFALSLAV